VLLSKRADCLGAQPAPRSPATTSP
jgi:hypothetical protein